MEGLSSVGSFLSFTRLHPRLGFVGKQMEIGRIGKSGLGALFLVLVLVALVRGACDTGVDAVRNTSLDFPILLNVKQNRIATETMSVLIAATMILKRLRPVCAVVV